MQKIIDECRKTVWKEECEGVYSLYLNFNMPKTFNSIHFTEKSQGEFCYKNSAGDTVYTNTHIYGIVGFSVFVSVDGEKWKKVYTQDEMGCRTVVLNDTYTAAGVRIDITTDRNAEILEIEFNNTPRYNKKLRVLSYVRRLEVIDNYTENIKYLTDISLIDYGYWTEKGKFIFGDTGYTESDSASVENDFKQRISIIRKINPDINIWYSMRRSEYDEKDKRSAFDSCTNFEALTDTCVSMCRKYGLCGIDFDFEYPEGEKQILNYNNFLFALGDKLHGNGFKLSVATSDFVNHRLSAEHIDYVNLMTYDRVTLDRFGRHNTYNSIYRQIEKIKSNGFKEEQILLGLGYYGRMKSGSEQIPYKKLIGAGETDSAVCRKNITQFYCADASLNADKVLLALQKNLNGVFSWSLTTDVPLSNKYSLAGSVKRTIDRFALTE